MMATQTHRRDLEAEMAFRLRRQGVFGGSDAPAVFGFSAWRDALDVYHAKTREVREEDVRRELEQGHSIDIWRGNRNERDAVRLYLEMRGREGRHESRQIFADGSDRVAVHVDGTAFSDPEFEAPFDETGVIEAKSPRAQTFARLISEGVGRYYLIQVQFNCAVTGRPWGALALFCDHHDAGPVLPVETAADPELGRLMVERAEAFMEDHVEAHVPPDPADWDLSEDEEVHEALLERSGEYVTVDDREFREAIAEPLIETYRLKKDAEERYENLRHEAQDWIEGHLDSDAVMLPEGSKLRVIRREGRTYLDEGKLREHRPLDRDAFMRAVAAGAIKLPGFDLTAHALRDLELRLERFEKQGSPSSHVRVYPSKG